jgi:hypothetical protein
MTKREDERQALARRLRNLSRDASKPSLRTQYILLAAFVLCLFVLDTDSWFQWLLLGALGLATAFLLRFARDRMSGKRRQSSFDRDETRKN